MAHLVYSTGLAVVRSYRRLRRPFLRPFPDFLKRKAADLLGHVSPLKLLLTVIAVWSCPDHFFKNFRRTIDGNSPLLSDPLELLTSALAFIVAVVAVATFHSIRMPKRTVVEGIAVIAFSMPIWAIPISFVADRLRSPD